MMVEIKSLFRIVSLLAAGMVMLTGLWASAQLPPDPRPLSEWMPAGALLYLESADFAKELADWNASEVKAEWVASANHDEFLTTRLMLKLRDVYAEFSEAAGFAPDLNALDTVAGDRTALALYDIRDLHFLYMSRLPAARLGENILTRAFSTYQQRSAAGESYYLREAGERVSVFAIVDDHVLVSTREDLMTSTLERMAVEDDAGGPDGGVAGEDWYQAAFAELPADQSGPVPLRMVMDLPRVVATPHFRSYWIQQNASAWVGYDAFIAQLTRSAEVLDESRILVRFEPIELVSNGSAATELRRHVPDGVGLFRLWDRATTEFALELIQTKIFAAGNAVVSGPRSAPLVNLSSVVGSVGDLETRIDEPPRPSLDGNLDLRPLEALMDSAGLEAVLHLESSLPIDGQVFVRSDAAIAFQAASDWDIDRVRAALTSAVASYQSVGGIGLGWRDVASGSDTLSQFVGLLPLTVHADGQTLWIARTPELLGAALEAASGAGDTAMPGAYLARYDHRAELEPYLKFMRMLEMSEPSRYSNFFSENVGSLASALDVIDSVRVRIDDDGRVQRQSVTYELGP